MFNKKLSKKELTELKKLTELEMQYKVISGMFENQKNAFLRNILPKYGIEPQDKFQIELKSGKIKKVVSKDKGK